MWRADVTRLRLRAVGEERRRRLLLVVALALAFVAEQLAGPHAQEALGAGVGAHGERRIGEGPGRWAGLHRPGRGQVLAAVDRGGRGLGRVVRLWLPWR